MPIVKAATDLRRICEQINNIEGAITSDEERQAARPLLRRKVEQAQWCLVQMLEIMEVTGGREDNQKSIALLEALRKGGIAPASPTCKAPVRADRA